MIQCYYYFLITILIDKTSNIRPLEQSNIPSIQSELYLVTLVLPLLYSELKIDFIISILFDYYDKFVNKFI